MKQTYDFERFTPPVLNEKMLRRELQKRAERRHTVLLAVAGVLFEILFVLFGILFLDIYPMLAFGCICFTVISIVGSVVIAIVFTQKGGVNHVVCSH